MGTEATRGIRQPTEPVLAMDDIQGIVVPGFFKPHQTLLGLRLPEGQQDATGLKSAVAGIAGQITTAKQALDDRRTFRQERRTKETRYPERESRAVFCAIGFSYNGLLRLTPGAVHIPSEAFQQGLVRRSPLLGDPSDKSSEGNPANWVVGAPSKELEALAVVAGDDRLDVDKAATDLKKRFRSAGIIIEYEEKGDVREGQERGHEHFGFDDGISQPGIRGRASDTVDDFITERFVDQSEFPEAALFGYPGQNLIWPGELVLGYPASSSDPLLPGPVAPCVPAWTRYGSFLVFRRLRQDVGLFWRTMKAEAEHLSKLPGFGSLSDDALAAKLVGRWLSGAPVNRVPGADNPALGNDPYANNYFLFDSDTPPLKLRHGHVDSFNPAKGDPAGVVCPWAAHIRKVNTRDSASDMGSTDSTYNRRLLRVGIPFGKSLANKYAETADDPVKGNRGLLFLSIQASIEQQFEFLMARWINDPSRPKMPGGNDMLVGQNAPNENGTRRCALFGRDLEQAEISTHKQWVIPTGGGYFFVPSLSTLRDVLAG